ncbi:MAG: hypothetical protein ACQEP3_00135 [Patescibacteria group bacterium]
MKEIQKSIFTIYKPLGISPLDAIKALKNKNPEIREKKMTYAGRLDPMAEGVFLVISGDELKNFHDHLKYDKEYKAQILFNFGSDSYDVLGLPTYNDETVNKKDIKTTIKSFEGSFKFKLPPFSGYKIKGKPLFKWALDDRLDEIEIPTKEVEIYNISINEFKTVGKDYLKKEINKKLSRVVGDFRQEKIKRRWNDLLDKNIKEEYIIVDVTINCSSGCYVRALANKAGESISSKALLFNLIRTKVGNRGIDSAIVI